MKKILVCLALLMSSPSALADSVRFDFPIEYKGNPIIEETFHSFDPLFRRLGRTEMVNSIRGHYRFQQYGHHLWVAENEYGETIMVCNMDGRHIIRFQTIQKQKFVNYEVLIRNKKIMALYEETYDFKTPLPTLPRIQK